MMIMMKAKTTTTTTTERGGGGGGHRKKVEKEVLLETRQRVRPYVPNVIGYARLLLVLASFYYANEKNRPHGMGSIGNGVRLRALVHLRRVGRSVCEKIQSMHRIWRGCSIWSPIDWRRLDC